MENRSEIQELTLEEVMGDRFGRYAKYIIQERALPDIRDGLKPVQRRILFAMEQDNNTADKGFRKSAKTVGNVIGNYHPHGDSSVYEAMVRLSQNWKQRENLIEMHGNNGSMDGDPPAAMRYTEARLAPISAELLKDIEKETVDFVLNFDDTIEEPIVLPAGYPNLLVNGASGISAGYATDIPTHNLGEVIDAAVYLVDHPDAAVSDLMKFIKGPDFPTGGIIQGTDEIKKAYETGKGKIIVRSKTAIETIRGGRQQIVVTEIPYEVNKANMVRKIDEVRLNRKVEGIAEVRDETDRNGLQIVIELKKEANAQGILTYLLKNTDLQIAYNFNMVAIDEMRPMLSGVKRILSAYLDHKAEVVKRRTTFELKKAQHRQHIVEGLIKAISILDDVIKTIRESKDKKNAKQNIIDAYMFTEIQAEAIVSLQLYRLTNTDITALQKEAASLDKDIKRYRKILDSAAEMRKTIKKELAEVRKKYAKPRITLIEDEIEELKVEKEVLIAEEEVIVSVTKEGYIKRTSPRSYSASSPEEIGLKEGDYPLFVKQMTTLEHLLIFTTKGNVIYRPIHEITDARWKDMGEHLSQTIRFQPDESVLRVFGLPDFSANDTFVFVTEEGYIKQTAVDQFKPNRSYRTRSSIAIKLKTPTDNLLEVILADQSNKKDVFLTTYLAFGLKYALDEVPVVGSKAAGVKSINLKDNDRVVGGVLFDEKQDKAEVLLVTQRGAVKKMDLKEFDTLGRAKRGLQVLRELKKNAHRVVLLIDVQNDRQHSFTILTDKDQKISIEPKKYAVSDRYSNGSFVLDENKDGKPIEYQQNGIVYLDQE